MTKKICVLMILGNLVAFFAQALPSSNQDQRVIKIYDHFERQLLWIKDNAWTACAQTLLEKLSHVDEDGLWQENYTPIVEILQKADLSLTEAQKKADELLTLTALNYVAEINGKRLASYKIAKEIYMKPHPVDEIQTLKNCLSLNQCSWVNKLAPDTSEYQHLKTLLSSYRQKQAQGGWPQLPEGTKLQKGDRSPFVKVLRTQLMMQDMLPSQGQENDFFDETLEKAVRAYQNLYALEKDGKVGKATLKALNTPVEDRIRSIIVNLERQRWYPRSLPSRYIQVNIPGFYLKAIDASIPSFFMRIITGKEQTKTPVFNTLMTGIVFNPSWYVPSSIAKGLLPKIQKNPEAYISKGYRIDNSSGQARVIQSPGPNNALGKIRFTIENSFAIYLHGTPQASLFRKPKRLLSHGCIRVQDPCKLAAFILNDPDQWPYARIEKETLGTKTTSIKLKQPFPVFVTYFTVFEKNGKTHFVKDKYGQNEVIWKLLEKLKKARQEEGAVASVKMSSFRK